MAPYHELNIYKSSQAFVVYYANLFKHFQREYRYTIGQRVFENLFEFAALIYTANECRTQKARLEILVDMAKKIRYISLGLRLANDSHNMSSEKYSVCCKFLLDINQQLEAWTKYTTAMLPQDVICTQIVHIVSGKKPYTTEINTRKKKDETQGTSSAQKRRKSFDIYHSKLSKEVKEDLKKNHEKQETKEKEENLQTSFVFENLEETKPATKEMTKEELREYDGIDYSKINSINHLLPNMKKNYSEILDNTYLKEQEYIDESKIAVQERLF